MLAALTAMVLTGGTAAKVILPPRVRAQPRRQLRAGLLLGRAR
jgi:hypothetical protein